MTVRARRPNRCIAPSGTPERRPLAPGLAMWLAIFGSLALLGVLRVLGKDGRVWATALGVLLVACVLVCLWAAAQGRAAERAIDSAVQRMAAARYEREHRSTPHMGGTDDRPRAHLHLERPERAPAVVDVRDG